MDYRDNSPNFHRRVIILFIIIMGIMQRYLNFYVPQPPAVATESEYGRELFQEL